MRCPKCGAKLISGELKEYETLVGILALGKLFLLGGQQ